MKKKKFILLNLFAFFIILSSCSNSRVYDIRDFGAKTDSTFNNAEVIQNVINRCNLDGGGKVIIPSDGVYYSGPINLLSNIELHLDAGAILRAYPDESLYTHSAFKNNRGEGMTWLYGKDLNCFSISGQGKLDGNGVAFMGKELIDSYKLKPVHDFDPRPHLLTLVNCIKVDIKDATIANSAYWAVHLVGCKNVLISGVDILNNIKIRNGDGIDIDHSKNVRISDCHIVSGDDCICFKNRREYKEYGACENISVSNCILTSRSSAIKFGSENVNRISHVVIDNCVIKDSNRGIGIQNRDEGTVEDVIFSNILLDCKFFSDVWWGKSEAIYVTSYPRNTGDNKDAGWRFPQGMKNYSVGAVSNIYFNNVKGVSENGVFLDASNIDKLQNIYFDNIDLLICKRTKYQGGIYDRRPCKGPSFVKNATYGFYLSNARNITIRNSSIKWGDMRPDYFKDILYRHNINGLITLGLTEIKAN